MQVQLAYARKGNYWLKTCSLKNSEGKIMNMETEKGIKYDCKFGLEHLRMNRSAVCLVGDVVVVVGGQQI